MLWYLVIGLAVLGLAAIGLALSRARAALDRAGEENQKLAHDRQRLFDFMALMAGAQGEGLSRQKLQQRIVHASILCTGALSGCLFERTERGTLRGVALEGLFPPHRPLSEAVRARLATRAKFIEEVLKGEEFPIHEGIVGRVAESRRGEWLADARSDPQLVKHDDPAVAVRSLIVVPLIFRDRFFGVLAVANPVGDQIFSAGDFALMQALAEQAALALHNAELLHR